MGKHPSTASRIVVRVSEAIARLSGNYIKSPNEMQSIQRTQQKFFDIAAFPEVIGAVDCSDFKIISPGQIYYQMTCIQ